MKVLIIIPARGGSKRLPGKNMRLLGGKPLLHYSLRAALSTSPRHRVVVSSDYEEAITYAKAFVPQVEVIRRPKSLSHDTSPAIDYVNHALGHEARNGRLYDAVAIVQPTSPFTRPIDIEGTIRAWSESGADGAASVVLVDHHLHPQKLKRIQGQLLKPYYENETGFAVHELEDVYTRNGSVYVTRVDGSKVSAVIPSNCAPYVMEAKYSIDINTDIDLAFAEYWLQTRTNLRTVEAQ